MRAFPIKLIASSAVDPGWAILLNIFWHERSLVLRCGRELGVAVEAPSEGRQHPVDMSIPGEFDGPAFFIILWEIKNVGASRHLMNFFIAG